MILVLVLLFCVGIAVPASASANSTCLTPMNERGICKLIPECPELFIRWKRRHSMPKSNIRFLLASQCGSQGRDPLLCCKEELLPTEEPVLGSRISLPDVNTHENVHLINPEFCGISSVDTRIINGNITEILEYPWMALLEYNDTKKGIVFGCGGTLINDKYVLTAAHCIKNTPRTRLVSVRLGESDKSTNPDCNEYEDETFCAPPYQSILIENVTMFPSYTVGSRVDDIALLRLAIRVNISNENIRPICLPLGTEQYRNLDGLQMTVSGWGATETGYQSSKLMKVGLPVTSKEQCSTTYKRSNVTIVDNQLCAGGTDQTQDSCVGDSGGPLKGYGIINSLARMIQYGIVSFGPTNCATRGVPGVYTRVGNYMNWILDNIQP